MAAGCELQAPLILTDQDVMLELMKHNIQLNELEGKATASILDWYVVTCDYPLLDVGSRHRCLEGMFLAALRCYTIPLSGSVCTTFSAEANI